MPPQNPLLDRLSSWMGSSNSEATASISTTTANNEQEDEKGQERQPHSQQESIEEEKSRDQPKHMQQDRESKSESERSLSIPVAWTLPILVLVDMLAVSLVVPLLFSYYKAAGVSSANHRELLSSLFNMAQIVGGIVLGVLKDAFAVQGRTLLLASFAGSAISYAMIAYSSTLASQEKDKPSSSDSVNWGLWCLMASRVLVGFVKQTMTVTTTMLTTIEPAKKDRAKLMGRLSASSTSAWILGPSLGSLLYKYGHPMAPTLLASALFVMNIMLVLVLLPAQVDSPTPPTTKNNKPNNNPKPSSDPKQSPWRRMISNLRLAFASPELAAVVVSRLVIGFVLRATSVASLGSFFEDMYQLETHQRGYVSSYQMLMTFAGQAALVRPILAFATSFSKDSEGGGGERVTACALGFGLAFVTMVQLLLPYLPVYLLVVIPVSSLSSSIMRVTLDTLTTQVAPQEAMFSVLAGLDILQNMVGVMIPFYRTVLFRFLAKDSADGAMDGDPEPFAWIASSSIHWLLAALLMSALLCSPSLLWIKTQQSSKKTKTA